MKILQVLGGGAWGGGSVVVLATTKALIARGEQVWVIALDDETARHFRDAGAVVVKPPCWYHPINPLDVIPFAYLIALCVRKRFDLVITHTSKGGILGRLAARLAGVPRIVHHVHGFSFHEFTHPLVRSVYVGFEKLAAPACDLLVTVAESHRRIAMRNGIAPAQKVRTVLNGIDLTRFHAAERAEARERLGFDEHELILGTVGRMAPQKGFTYMIQAMPAILAAFPSARFVICGEGPLEEELRREARQRGVEEQVTFLGFRRDVAGVLAAFDIFVHPSLWEGLSISLMEAMAAGKPIVASDIWGNREMIDHEETGLLATPARPEALVGACRRLLADPALAEQFGRNAREYARKQFTQRRMVEENIAAYDSVVPRARAAGRDVPEWKPGVADRNA